MREERREAKKEMKKSRREAEKEMRKRRREAAEGRIKNRLQNFRARAIFYLRNGIYREKVPEINFRFVSARHPRT